MSSTDSDRILRLVLATGFLSVLASACGAGGKPPADRPSEALGRRSGLASGMADSTAEEPKPAPKPKPDPVKVSGTRGVLQTHEVQAGFSPHQAALSACFQDQLKQRKFLSGDIKIQFAIEPTGQVGSARILQSDVGDWTVERCILDVSRKMTFAQPKGGNRKAEFSVPLHFESDQAKAEVWSEQQIASVVTAKRAELDACSSAAGAQAPGEVTVTLYIGNRGAVQSVGVASAHVKPLSDAWADCAAKAVATWTFADPQGKIVKAGFRYRPGGK